MTTDFIIILVLFLTAVNTYLIIYYLYSKLGKKEKIFVDEKEMQGRVELILSQEDIVKKVDDIVGAFIKSATQTYMSLRVPMKEKEIFIDNATAEEMTKYVTETVKKNMTPEILSMIRLINNVNTKEEIEDYIGLKIKLYIIAFVLDANGPIVN